MFLLSCVSPSGVMAGVHHPPNTFQWPDALTAAGLFDSSHFYLIELIFSYIYIHSLSVRSFALSLSLSFCVCVSLYIRVNTLILWRASTAKGLQLNSFERESAVACLDPVPVLFLFFFSSFTARKITSLHALSSSLGRAHCCFLFVQILLRCMSAAASDVRAVRKCCNEITRVPYQWGVLRLAPCKVENIQFYCTYTL